MATREELALVEKVAASMVFDQPEMVDCFQRLGRGADPEAEGQVILACLRQANVMQAYKDALAERDEARKDAVMLADSCIAISQDRDHRVDLYEAAMNWFSHEDWTAFEESDLFKDVEAHAPERQRS